MNAYLCSVCKIVAKVREVIIYEEPGYILVKRYKFCTQCTTAQKLSTEVYKVKRDYDAN